MLKHFIVAAVSLSSLAFAGPHGARPVLVPPPPAPVVAQSPYVVSGPYYGNGGDHADVARARTLVGELNSAIARRDFRRVQLLDNQMQAFMQSELAESQGIYGRGDNRSTVRQIRSLKNQLASLNGRLDPIAMQSRRSLYNQAVSVAMSDVQRGNGRVYGRR
jgi:hypothetical protein